MDARQRRRRGVAGFVNVVVRRTPHRAEARSRARDLRVAGEAVANFAASC